HASKRQCLFAIDQLLDAAGVQQRLHVLLGLVEVEKLPVGLVVAHLQDAAALVPDGVGLGAHGDLDDRLTPIVRLGLDVVRQAGDLAQRDLVAGLDALGDRVIRIGSFLRHGFSIRLEQLVLVVALGFLFLLDALALAIGLLFDLALLGLFVAGK